MADTHRIGKHATKVTKDGKTSTVRYHWTDVVTVDWEAKTVTLNNGGYTTATTKLRMNQASSEWGLGYQVSQKDFEWYVNVGGKTYNYYDGAEAPSGKFEPKGRVFKLDLD